MISRCAHQHFYSSAKLPKITPVGARAILVDPLDACTLTINDVVTDLLSVQDQEVMTRRRQLAEHFHLEVPIALLNLAPSERRDGTFHMARPDNESVFPL